MVSQNNQLVKSISSAINKCIENGSCSGINLMDANNTTISAEWETWEVDSGYDVVAIYFYQDGIITFYYQVEETKVNNLT